MAKSILDGTEWTATEFAELLPEEQRATRQELACLSCDGRAVFRAGQQRQPSFAARHRQDCRLVSRPWSAFRFLAEAGRGTQRAVRMVPQIDHHTSPAVSSTDGLSRTP
ncbi:competence protein CoiA family protein [Paenarthrobacter nitroguajacolicus]